MGLIDRDGNMGLIDRGGNMGLIDRAGHMGLIDRDGNMGLIGQLLPRDSLGCKRMHVLLFVHEPDQVSKRFIANRHD